MPAIPTKRLFVYIFMGLIVLVVGTVGMLSMRGEAASRDSGTEGLLSENGVIVAAADSLSANTNAGVLGQFSSTTTTTSISAIYVQVAGAVRRPGVYQVSPDTRVFEVVAEAGGFTEEADQQGLALAAPLTDGCRVYVPRVGEVVTDSIASPDMPGGEASDCGESIVSINNATLEQLDSLPGIGPAIAQDIITYREANGPFTSIDQLREVPGIGTSRMEQLRPLIKL